MASVRWVGGRPHCLRAALQNCSTPGSVPESDTSGDVDLDLPAHHQKASGSRPWHHPPQPHPITGKALLSPARAAVNVVVLVAMYRGAHAHAAGQLVQVCKAVLVVAGRFVGDEDVGLLRGQLFQLVGVDAGPVLEVFTASREDAWRLMLEADEWATGLCRPGPLLDS